ncbi:hypothetical protein OROGR_029747 [Orobanche gracilis]
MQKRCFIVFFLLVLVFLPLVMSIVVKGAPRAQGSQKKGRSPFKPQAGDLSQARALVRLIFMRLTSLRRAPRLAPCASGDGSPNRLGAPFDFNNYGHEGQGARRASHPVTEEDIGYPFYHGYLQKEVLSDLRCTYNWGSDDDIWSSQHLVAWHGTRSLGEVPCISIYASLLGFITSLGRDSRELSSNFLHNKRLKLEAAPNLRDRLQGCRMEKELKVRGTSLSSELKDRCDHCLSLVALLSHFQRTHA